MFSKTVNYFWKLRCFKDEKTIEEFNFDELKISLQVTGMEFDLF